MRGQNVVALLVLLALALTACAAPAATPVTTETPVPATPTATAAPAPTPTPTEVPLVVVRVGQAPFFDHQWIPVAKEFGWDHELGIDMEFITLAQTGQAVQALVSGSVDVIPACVVCHFAFRESVPDLTTIFTENQFAGFLFIGRKGGPLKTYWEFLDELGDPEAAKEATLLQLKGTTWPVYRANYDPLIGSALSQVGLTLDDINEINFADDEKAALAFIGGTGDVFTGSLPQESRMLLDMPDQFVNLGGAEILGPAGLWYSNIAALRPWILENKEVVLKLTAMSYRYNRYLEEDPDAVLPIVVRVINDMTGSTNTVKDVKQIFDAFLDFRTWQRERDETYNPDSIYYWRLSADHFVQQSIEQGTYPAHGEYLSVNIQEDLFKEFLQRQDLLDWVDAPLD